MDIGFDPLAPGTSLRLFGQLGFTGPDGIIRTDDTFAGDLSVLHTLLPGPVVGTPEPGSALLVLLAPAGMAGLGTGKRRAQRGD